MRYDAKVWRVRAYIEYEIEAPDEECAIKRLRECIVRDLAIDWGDIRDIAEVTAEKVSDEPLDRGYLPYN